MTDTITPDEYRVAAKVVGATWKRDDLPCSAEDVVADLEREAARLEAESARDEEAEKLAEVYRVAFKSAAGDSYIADGSWAVAGVRAVLDQLAADGRLLPESGELTEAVKASLTDALDTVLSAVGVSLPVPDSGPDGTPEKPWPTWQDVPEGVRYWSERQRSHRWVNRGGKRFMIGFTSGVESEGVADEKTMTLRAPFVRVDGDKA